MAASHPRARGAAWTQPSCIISSQLEWSKPSSSWRTSIVKINMMYECSIGRRQPRVHKPKEQSQGGGAGRDWDEEPRKSVSREFGPPVPRGRKNGSRLVLFLMLLCIPRRVQVKAMEASSIRQVTTTRRGAVNGRCGVMTVENK